MSETNLFQGSNQAFAAEMYANYLKDPNSVDETTRTFFNAYPLPDISPSPSHHTASPANLSEDTLTKALATARLARLIRQRGHLEARISPLATSITLNPELDLANNNLTKADLEQLPAVIIGGVQAENSTNAYEAIERLKVIYTGTIGYEDEHIQDARERYWLREAAESRKFFQNITTQTRLDLLNRLTEVDIFEDFLQKNFQGEKRFSLEGNDSLVPILDELIRHAAISGCREVVMGMSHRGRLNVLAHVLGKPIRNIFKEFKKNTGSAQTSVAGGTTEGWSGDVKYHLGYKNAFMDNGIEAMPITLVPNPSHLEAVDPVVEGHVRAAQDRRDHSGTPVQDTHVAMPILIHGDAAFPGQGIVSETLNLSRLPGYRTGGTIHIIVNNQIGFTTLPTDGRSTLYASDLAKGFEIPIVHVNADDPVACIAAARMAFAYREQFGKDFLIDLVGYRRYGHNETDEPRTTQPSMYSRIDSHPTPREVWAKVLESEGLITAENAQDLVNNVRAALREELDSISLQEPENREHGTASPPLSSVNTAVPESQLRAFNEDLLSIPDSFTANPVLISRFYEPRRTLINEENGIMWAHAESLAFASILADGIPIRLTGQDTERGTFDQRRLVLHDINKSTRYVPMEHLPSSKASFSVYNSPLSENACLGFEYGYSMHASGVLTLWEAQFGDFANGAQVIIDQFLAPGRAKWAQTPSLVLLLPHGYEGQGAEHSSARIERFLQLAASDNLRIANCTTAAQYFHLLRAQAKLLEDAPRPLIIFTPKSLLRDKSAAASLSDLTSGTFHPVLSEQMSNARRNKITRLVLCSGKVYVNLTHQGTTPRKEYVAAENLTATRVELLFPFPDEELSKVVSSFPNLQEIVWLQEEPMNMGAWFYAEPRLRNLCRNLEWRGKITYLGREASASAAEGSNPRHRGEQERIISAVLSDVPTLKSASSSVARASR